MENARLFLLVSNSTGKCSKLYTVSSQVVFPQHFFLIVPKSGDSLKEQTEKMIM